ncbi:EamA family transporter RarD [Leeia sp. TBRC 13508]|uniref:EamA family transporter RarD n=1 Tax=Leeia speluncae TaxID=2884804 RepID=A0ABS8DAF2_9NEIS|nr:EamA family transporter RarD [Leeia speluncae]MCB6185149.1 EamA family transporter RarD [Leeia speluncae]
MFKGVLLSVASSCMFAGLYYYATLLQPLTGVEIFGWRMLLTLPCITLFMVIGKEWKHVTHLMGRVWQRPTLLLGLIASSALLGIQQWLFLWAPVNGRGLQVSLGYFLLPLTMLLVGRIVYREQLSIWQKLASLAATAGVLHQLYVVGGLSWEVLLVAFGFPCYFVLRQKLATNHLGGLWFDMLFTLPFAIWSIWGTQSNYMHDFHNYPNLFFLIILLALISAAAFMAYLTASRLLSLSLFGLLGYVEPVLMVLVALLLGEHIHQQEWLTYLPIWTAVGLLVIDGIKHVRQKAIADHS